MGQIRQVGDIYYIEFYARGLMYSQVAGPSKEEAQRLLDQVEAKIAQGEALTIVREIDLEIFFEKFLEYAKRQFSPKSIERFTRMWTHLVGFVHSSYPHVTKLSQLTPSVIEAYRAALLKTTKPKVINLTILLLRETVDYGIKIGFLNDNPTLHINLLEIRKRSIKSSPRSDMAKDLLSRDVALGKVYEILKLKDVAQVMYWSNFIPLKREDVYN